MDIEDTIERKSYRGFELVHLRHGKATATRWQITRNESGLTCSYGFVESESHAHSHINSLFDGVLKGTGR